MAKKAAGWKPFPHPDADFSYPGAALKKHWTRLHIGDQEPFPSAQYLARLCKAHPEVARAIPKFDGDFGALSEKLQDAWRSYHQGDFQHAAQIGTSLGPVGYSVADKATSIYANYLEPSTAARLKMLETVMTRAEEARALLPEHPNAHYQYAYALGRHSQGTSVLQALAEGVAPKIRDALAQTLDLAPGHAEAHIASGTFHAQIIEKVGSLLGGITYGVSRDKALEHYRRALTLHPASAIARIEYAWGLVSMFGQSRIDEATRLVVDAAHVEPADAMERLDVALAESRLEEG